MTNQFINPYTFIPLEDEVERNKPEKGDLSGVITCSLTIKSPTFIPNTHHSYTDKECSELKIQEFFSYDALDPATPPNDKNWPKYPRIPGSELRGMIRNVYEQVTNSCFSVISRTYPHKRSPKPKKLGLWDRESNTLYACKKAKLYTRRTHQKNISGECVDIGKYKTGDLVYMELKNNKKSKSGDKIVSKISIDLIYKQEGYVLIGEPFGEDKYYDAVAYDRGKKIKELTPEDIIRFEQVLIQYLVDNKVKDTSLNNFKSKLYKSYREAYVGYKENKQKYRYLPVYYSKVENNIYLSPACITKEVFSETYDSLLSKEENGCHQPCDGKDGKWCPACALFGMVDQSGQELANARKGKLRFCDSEVIKDVKFDNLTILPVLGTPKPSATEFYLKKPENADYWNYDYYIGNSGKAEKYVPILRGRKVYWLKKLIQETPSSNPDKNNMQTKVRPLTAGQCNFNIYYQDLTEEELSVLLWCLQLEKGAYHRIGRGKPLGMGAVELKVESVTALNYTWDEESREISRVTSHVPYQSYRLPNDPQFTKRQERILKYSTPLSDEDSELVSYPVTIGENLTKTYEWFVNNRGKLSQKPKIEEVLPHIDEDAKLKKNTKPSK